MPVGRQRIIFCGRELNASGRPLKHSGVGVNGMLAIHMVARRRELHERNSIKSRKKVALKKPVVLNFANDGPIFPIVPNSATSSARSGESSVINLVDDSPVAKGCRRRGRRKSSRGRSDSTRGP